MILYLTAGLFGGYNETIKFEELGISTHSLTRRLTVAEACGSPDGKYFNSQPHKEADGNRAYMPMYHAEISTHSLTRRLTLLLRETLRFYYISTHSLTRRLTHPFHSPSSCPVYFNSQPHKEADRTTVCIYCICIYFNSQPHKEADPLLINTVVFPEYFNSQPHKEADWGPHFSN